MRTKYKIFKVINVFDLLIVLACAALVYGAYLFSMPHQVVAEEGRMIRFTVELSEHPAGFYQQIEPGPLVFESSHGIAIGNVVYAYSLPFLQDVPDEANNIFRRTPVYEREFTYIVIETWANVSDFETEVNQFRVAVNRDIYVRSRDFAGRGFITNVDFLE